MLYHTVSHDSPRAKELLVWLLSRALYPPPPKLAAQLLTALLPKRQDFLYVRLHLFRRFIVLVEAHIVMRVLFTLFSHVYLAVVNDLIESDGLVALQLDLDNG